MENNLITLVFILFSVRFVVTSTNFKFNVNMTKCFSLNHNKGMIGDLAENTG